MKRYNTFYLIHKALRAMLYDTALTLQQTDFANYTEARAALVKVNDVLFAFDNHAHHEDNFIMPAVETYEPALAASFEKEHVEDLRISNRLKNIIVIYENTFFPEERTVCGSAITKSFTEFLVFNLEHMAKEEEVLNPILWRYYTDKELKELTQAIIAKIEPEQMEKFSTWMMRGLHNGEITGWLKEVERNAPEPVFQSLFTVAERELPQRRFRLILECLTEGAMLA